MKHDSELLSPRAARRVDAVAPSTPTTRGRWGALLNGVQTRLQLSHLLMSLLPLLALGSLLIFTSVRSEQHTAQQVQESVAGSIAADIKSLLSGVGVELAAIGARADDLDGPAALQAAADDVLARHAGLILELALLDSNGGEVFRRAQPGVAADLPLRRRVAELVSRVALDGNRHWNVVRPRRGPPSIQIGVPITDGTGLVTGVVVAEVGTQLLAQRLASIPSTTGRSAFLVDQRGDVLVGQPSRALATGQNLGDAWQPDAALATVATDDGNIVLARAELGEGWFVVVEQPAVVAAPDGGSATLMTVLLVCTVVLVGAWAVVLAREMSGPLLRLREAARNVGAGGSTAGVPVERPDEVGELAVEFNRMLELLAASRDENEQRGRELQALRHELEQRDTELRTSLELASRIQSEMLPGVLPPDAPVDVAVRSEPAGDIADFSAYIALPDGRVRVLLGDASGSGVAAALLLALAGSLAEAAAHDAAGPAELLERVNSLLYPRLGRAGSGVGMLAAEFDQRSGRLSVANAGMIAPLVAEQGGQASVEAFGPPLGEVEAPRYEATSVPLMAGQVAVFVSDGIVEARGGGNEMWGFARLERTITVAAGGGPEAIVEQVLAAVRGYSAAHTPSDSRTVIAVRLKPVADNNGR